MLTDGRDRDHDHRSHSGMYDLPRGRSEAAEDFGVPLRPAGASTWDGLMSWIVPDLLGGTGWLGWFTTMLLWMGAIVIMGIVVLVALLTVPPHPMDTATLQTALFFAAFAVAALMYGGILALAAFVSWRERSAEGRRIYERLTRAQK